MDTIIGGKHQRAILSCVDRKSKLLIPAKLLEKTTIEVARAMIGRLKNLSQRSLLLTFDKDKEFTAHKKMNMGLSQKSFIANIYESDEC